MLLRADRRAEPCVVGRVEDPVGPEQPVGDVTRKDDLVADGRRDQRNAGQRQSARPRPRREITRALDDALERQPVRQRHVFAEGHEVVLGVADQDLAPPVIDLHGVEIECPAFCPDAVRRTGHQERACGQRRGDAGAGLRILVEISGKGRLGPEHQIDRFALGGEAGVAVQGPLPRARRPFFGLRKIPLNDAQRYARGRRRGPGQPRRAACPEHQGQGESGADRGPAHCCLRQPRGAGKRADEDDEKAQPVASHPGGGLAQRVELRDGVGWQVPGKTCQHMAAQPFRSGPDGGQQECGRQASSDVA